MRSRRPDYPAGRRGQEDADRARRKFYAAAGDLHAPDCTCDSCRAQQQRERDLLAQLGVKP